MFFLIYRHLYDNKHLIIDIFFIYIWNSHQSLLAKGNINDFENSHTIHWPYTFACKINRLFEKDELVEILNNLILKWICSL